MTGLFGEYRHTIDAKGRLSMPSRLLKALGDPFFISVSEDKCLNIYSAAQWEKLEEEKFSLLSDGKERASRRNFYSLAQEGSLDAQNRVVLTQKLRNYAGLEKNVVIAGAGKYAEIWDAGKWDSL
jgi:MraZ protein